jgi:hypothetical protein
MTLGPEQAENIVANINSIPECHGQAYVNGRPPEIMIGCRKKEITNRSTHPCTIMDGSGCPSNVREEKIWEAIPLDPTP